MANAPVRRKGGMTDSELTALLDGQITDAVSYEGSELSQLRIRATEFMDGEIDVPAEEGKSRVVSNDLADTLHWIMPGMLRVFLASDNVAIYEPRKPGSEDGAKQATDYINYAFLTDCKGYHVLYGAFYDGLLYGNGIIKHWWDPTPQYSVESFTGLSDDQFNFLVADEDVEEVLEHSEYPDPSFTFASAQPNPALVAAASPVAPQAGMGMGAGSLAGGPLGPGAAVPSVDAGVPAQPAGSADAEDGPDGDAASQLTGDGGASALPIAPQAVPLGAPFAPQVPLLHDCKIKRKTSNGQLQVKVLPPEEFLIERNATVLDEDHVRFCGHRYLETRSNLVKAGYPRDKVNQIPRSEYLGTNQERLARENIIITQSNTMDESVEDVEVYECYILADYDGDGIAEWRKVVIGGPAGNRSILANDEWGEDLPFSDLVPEPVPHRWRGRSLYDVVAPRMRIKTVLQRQTLDNLYHTNNPMQEVVEGQILNMDALINRELGANIFVKTPNVIRTLDVPFTAKESFAMLDYLDKELEKNTGVSSATQALDPAALMNQTATAVNAAQTAAYSKQETYARNMAEVGMKRLFRQLLKLIVKHQDRARTIRLRGQWVEMDPRGWDAEMDLSINTGLGSGSRDRDMQMLSGIKATQENILKILGPTNPLADLGNYRNTLAKLCEISGIKNVDSFFKEIDPQTLQQMANAPKPPDPHVQAAQMKAQTDSQKMQMQNQLEQQKMQLQLQHDQQKAQMDFAMRQKEAEFAQQMEQARAQRDALAQDANLKKQSQIEQLQMQADIEMKRQEAAFKATLQQQKFEHDKQMEMLKLWVQAQHMGIKSANSFAGGENTVTPDALGGMMEAGAGGITPDHIKQAATPKASPIEQALAKLTDLMAQGHAQHGARFDRLEAVVAAPTEVVRHPQSGQVVGARKVLS